MKRLILTAFAALTMFIGVNAQTKVAHINLSELMNAMPEMKDFEKKMKDYEGVLRAQLETMQAELQTKYQSYITDTTSPPAIMEIKKKKRKNFSRTSLATKVNFLKSARNL